jgi:glycosyltransferase involved in cell wall biosynthesis
MHKGNKIIIVMPAYNAEKTLEQTVRDIPQGFADEIILCDDDSQDHTLEIAKNLGLTVIAHPRNKGYGANQKSCYDLALQREADIIVMVHPDYQYDPRVIPFAVGFLETDICDVIMGSRIRTRKETLEGGMPVYKYLSNRFLTIVENIALGQNLGDFHSGFRVFKRKVLKGIAYKNNSDDFIFDAECLAQIVHRGYRIGDIPIPTRYFAEASSINFLRSLIYGLGCLGVVMKFLLQSCGLGRFKIFQRSPSNP